MRLGFTTAHQEGAQHIDLGNSGWKWDIDQFNTLRVWDEKKQLVGHFLNVTSFKVGRGPR